MFALRSLTKGLEKAADKCEEWSVKVAPPQTPAPPPSTKKIETIVRSSEQPLPPAPVVPAKKTQPTVAPLSQHAQSGGVKESAVGSQVMQHQPSSGSQVTISGSVTKKPLPPVPGKVPVVQRGPAVSAVPSSQPKPGYTPSPSIAPVGSQSSAPSSRPSYSPAPNTATQTTSGYTPSRSITPPVSNATPRPAYPPVPKSLVQPKPSVTPNPSITPAVSQNSNAAPRSAPIPKSVSPVTPSVPKIPTSPARPQTTSSSPSQVSPPKSTPAPIPRAVSGSPAAEQPTFESLKTNAYANLLNLDAVKAYHRKCVELGLKIEARHVLCEAAIEAVNQKNPKMQLTYDILIGDDSMRGDTWLDFNSACLSYARVIKADPSLRSKYYPVILEAVRRRDQLTPPPGVAV